MNFIQSIYPFNLLEDFMLSDVYKKVEAVKFNKGEVIKCQNEITKKVYLIF